MISKKNISTRNDDKKIREVEILQESSDNVKFVISEVFLVDSDDETDNSRTHVTEPASDPFAQSIYEPTSCKIQYQSKNLGRLSKIQRFHDLPCSSKSQPARRDHYSVCDEDMQDSEAIELSEANLIEHNPKKALHSFRKGLPPRIELDKTNTIWNHSEAPPQRIPRLSRAPTQRSKNNLCRLCEQHSYALTSIFGISGKTSNIIEKIHLHLPITVKKNDKLPQGICGLCLQALKTFHDLYHKSLSTDSHLREVFLKEDSSKVFSFHTDSILFSKEPIIQTPEEVEAPTSNQNKFTSEPSKTTKNTKKRPRVESSQEELPDQDSDSSKSDDGVGELSVNPESSLQDEDEEYTGPSDSPQLEEETCDICQQTFSSNDEMKAHRITTHSTEERLKCKVCEEIMPHDKSYKHHMLTHSGNAHLCPKCGKVFASSSGVRAHLILHEDPKFCCQICGKTFHFIAKLESHMLTHTDKRDWECEKCGQKFKLKVSLTQHMNIHSQIPKFVCDLCGYTVHRAAHLRYHMSIHHNGENGVLRTELKYPCDMCNMKFIKKFNLLRHQVAAHGTKPAVIVGETLEDNQKTKMPLDALCIYCNIQYPNKEALLSHKAEVHPHIPGTRYSGQASRRQAPSDQDSSGQAPKRVFTCPHCGKDLRTKVSLDNHVRSHTGERPFLCSICGESFKTRAQRQNHEFKHTNHRPYKCTICDKAFFGYTGLYQHKKIHNSDKQYKCNVCSYKTCRSAALQLHLRVHTNEKPYACELCDKKYKSSWDLKLHKRVHSGEAPYRRNRSKPKEMRQHVESGVSDLNAPCLDDLNFCL